MTRRDRAPSRVASWEVGSLSAPQPPLHAPTRLVRLPPLSTHPSRTRLTSPSLCRGSAHVGPARAAQPAPAQPGNCAAGPRPSWCHLLWRVPVVVAGLIGSPREHAMGTCLFSYRGGVPVAVSKRLLPISGLRLRPSVPVNQSALQVAACAGAAAVMKNTACASKPPLPGRGQM